MLDCLPEAPERVPAPQRRRGQRKRVLVADLFCGAGGSSTGAQRALEAMDYEMELVCVNHWDKAIETHTKNHPTARHYCQDIATVRPLEAVPGGKLDLLMASPTCTFHSRARGGRPTSDQQRMDPWHLLDWLTQLDVRCLLIENVPEFVNWGRVDPETGKPVAKEKGGYFLKWVKTLKLLGYKADWRIIVAADYGDATTRERFFLIARKDRKPIVWPEPTHSKDGGADLFGTRPKWRAAREIINWSHKGQSIFDRKKPLAPKTLARIMAGATKFRWPEPFLVILRQHMDGRSIDAPLPTITAGGTHIGLAEPTLTPFILGQQTDSAPRDVAEPIPTISTAGAISLTEPIVFPFQVILKGRSDCRPIDAPLATITNIPCMGVAEPMLAPYYGGGSGETCTSIDAPLPTITTVDRFGLVESTVEPFVISTRHGKEGAGPAPRAVSNPLPTITAGGSQVAVVAPDIQPIVIQTDQSSGGAAPRSADEPLGTIVTKQNQAIVEAILTAAQSNEHLAKAIAQRRVCIIDGELKILDIRFRMLEPSELAKGMSFTDGELGYEFVGSKADQTKQIGNAVPVRTSTALVSAIMSV